MNTQEKQYFRELTKDRTESANVLEKPSLSGVQHSVVEKYSDQAHFIYELLQNADDVKATRARFHLYKDKLVFTHNGTKHFNISNPSTEAEDAKNGVLGDLNAITSVANSAKGGNKATIGKFGVGFKAVFQYTDTPHIYDPNVAFKIERFIVPNRLDEDYPNRNEDETVFVFPFDHRERAPREAFEDIFDKLRGLVYPILFLQHLQDVSFDVEDSDTVGIYEKHCTLEKCFDDITARRLELEYSEGDELAADRIWLFSRTDDFGRDYCVGFFFDENEKLKPVNMPAFCYFPTKEDTKLHFAVHAPFLLTDSREGIKAGEDYNRELISKLARLAADALPCLRSIGDEEEIRIIDDDILNIVPTDSDEFSALYDKSRISFMPFYTDMMESLADGLLPTRDGYTDRDHAFWSYTIDINSLFSDEQISLLFAEEDSHWVFCSKPRHAFDAYDKAAVRYYIDGIVNNWYDETDIFDIIDGDFICQQPLEWLHRFYKWIADTPRRFSDLKTKPIFINADDEAAAAYDESGSKTLFLPSAEVKDCPTVHPELLQNGETASFLRDVVKLEEPSLQDYIYNTVIPNYKNDEEEDPFTYFKLFFKYYKECRATEIDSYIEKIKDLDFLEYIDSDGEYCRRTARMIYYPDDRLKEYFCAKPNVPFLALEQYTDEFPNDADLNVFLNELGIAHLPRVFHRPLGPRERAKYPDLPREYSTKHQLYRETRIDGCIELAEYIAQSGDADKSYCLWNMLLAVFDENPDIEVNGKYEYYYYSPHTIPFKSLTAKKLCEEKWLVSSDGSFICAEGTTLSLLSGEYDVQGSGAAALTEYLGFARDEEEEEITEEQKLADMCKKYGMESEADFLEFREWKNQRERKNDSAAEETADSEPQNTMDAIATDIKKRAKHRGIQDKPDTAPLREEDNSETDIDEYTPVTIDYASKIENKKEEQATELRELAKMQELQDIAVSAEKYSYLWFKTLLDMEIFNSDADSISNREININFGKIERDEGTKKTYILSRPNKYIPQYTEDLTGIPLVLHMNDGTQKQVAIEVSAVKSYSLYVMLKDAQSLSDTDLSAVREVSVKVSRPVFLLQALREKLAGLKDENGCALADEYNMKNNLPENLEFIFGPPGTGKTTYLANKVLMPLMQQKEDVRVLVLTPTNKAADVITAKIMESMGSDMSYTKWLARFGVTGDELIENSEVFRDKTFDPRKCCRCVTVTTIARFAYDFFMPVGERLYIDALKWDYIVIDEASMIPAVQIVYPLFRKTPKKFIIAGDPFQIAPVTTVDIWADENIYTLTELNSFTAATATPHDYPVVRLTTQYRSTPEIGEIFSNFAYGGILHHHRKSESRRDLHLDGIIDMNSLNILKFPVSKYESIYRAKRLSGTTPYHIYSAIFTAEFANYLCTVLKSQNPGVRFNIGIIAPYRAQASLIDRLMSFMPLPREINVQVGTIHGFQGDECDIVFVVLNTPPSISASPKLFLNKQNILNVAVSRARDYIFVVMPDDRTDNVCRLQKVKKIEELMRRSGHFTERTTAEIEQLMFGDEKFIENNSFATSHQSVNVYGHPEKYYEIRSEDTAIDIQVHRD